MYTLISPIHRPHSSEICDSRLTQLWIISRKIFANYLCILYTSQWIASYVPQEHCTCYVKHVASLPSDRPQEVQKVVAWIEFSPLIHNQTQRIRAKRMQFNKFAVEWIVKFSIPSLSWSIAVQEYSLSEVFSWSSTLWEDNLVMGIRSHWWSCWAIQRPRTVQHARTNINQKANITHVHLLIAI